MTMTKARTLAATAPTTVIHVAEHGSRTPKHVVRCEIGTNVAFSTASLESYFFAGWEPVAYDALLVAAAVEFADRTRRRPAFTWQREIVLRVPVHDADRWQDRRVQSALHDALAFLTGDRWHVEFHPRRKPATPAQQGLLSLQPGLDAVIPFSNGLDSRAVAALMTHDIGPRLVRIRLGSMLADGKALTHERQPFTAVPYRVKAARRSFVEPSARSRGFKFALISGIAAHLAQAAQVIVPESGQGALGPALVTVGQSYEDYRSHPLFTGRMERLIEALFGHRVRYVFPRLWNTKGETLRRFVEVCGDQSWSSTWSCWRQNRHVSVDGGRRQCGVCAACMLRRMSVHAAGLSEAREHYVWADLSAPTFEAGAAASYRAKGKITSASREYAIAGALHLDHLADLRDRPTHSHALALAAVQLAGVLGLAHTDAQTRLDRLLRQHSTEWEAFMLSLGAGSFVADWAARGRA
jgi:7-cyano-7-deazaguanine synthase in queuosine biosynthesis